MGFGFHKQLIFNKNEGTRNQLRGLEERSRFINQGLEEAKPSQDQSQEEIPLLLQDQQTSGHVTNVQDRGVPSNHDAEAKYTRSDLGLLYMP